MHQNYSPIPMDGSCRREACVKGSCYRFTLLTERILRMEYDPEGIFEDRPSQTVLCRNFPVPEYHVRDTGERLEIDCKHFHMNYYYGNGYEFTENSIVIDAKNSFTSFAGRWHYGTKTYSDPPRHMNLMGTARTLDKADGAVPLEYGLMDRGGRSFFDDSETSLFDADGKLQPRRPGTVDMYYICCQHDYEEALKDFYRITGRPPMLPRYALGNWWSRYYAYTAKNYLELMDRFREADIPFSVAVLDMDWHITKVDPKYGTGWTGFTWNRDYFPDPEGFLATLHGRGLHTALNLHPADGVQAYEAAYPKMAAATGADPQKEEPVPFDITDDVFRNAYFEHLIHPLEQEGVDHWWIDWQQGRKCAVPNADPLWLLNHYHYTDNCRQGKRGLILSRYAGVGAHRYPAGFSGDAASTWESLEFQAYFTATATNVGFTFWSHDIGGFTGGLYKPELLVRWLQLGVFSPFMRLHSTCNPFATKEPWNYPEHVQPVIAFWLQLRHRLIPYLYTQIHRQHESLEPLIKPMYYDYPDEGRAYSRKTQYMFGGDLMICPITAPADEITGMGSVKAWIPEGCWTDIFTGKTYTGHRVAILNRPLKQYPVLAKAGAIIPMAIYPEKSNSTDNPDALEILVFPDASGSYVMYEDDGLTDSGNAFYTEFAYDKQGRTFSIRTNGDSTLVPAKRKYRITFRGVESFTVDTEHVENVAYDPECRSVSIELAPAASTDEVVLELPDIQKERNSDVSDRVFRFLLSAETEINIKRDIYALLQRDLTSETILEELHADGRNRRLTEVLTEMLTN